MMHNVVVRIQIRFIPLHIYKMRQYKDSFLLFSTFQGFLSRNMMGIPFFLHMHPIKYYKIEISLTFSFSSRHLQQRKRRKCSLSLSLSNIQADVQHILKVKLNLYIHVVDSENKIRRKG